MHHSPFGGKDLPAERAAFHGRPQGLTQRPAWPPGGLLRFGEPVVAGFIRALQVRPSSLSRHGIHQPDGPHDQFRRYLPPGLWGATAPDVTSHLSTMGCLGVGHPRSSGRRQPPGPPPRLRRGHIGRSPPRRRRWPRPLSSLLGGLCVKVVPLLVELGPPLLELLLHVGHKAGPRRGQMVVHLGATRLHLLASSLGGGLGLRHESRAARRSPYGRRPCGPRRPSPAAIAQPWTPTSLASDSETVGMISSECDGVVQHGHDRARGGSSRLGGRAPWSWSPWISPTRDLLVGRTHQDSLGPERPCTASELAAGAVTCGLAG